jgi:transposase
MGVKVLKKEERIEALAMIMVLCLLIYSYAEWKLRRKLKKAGQSVPNQLKKPTQKPTMRWIFQLFMRVTLIIVTEGQHVISRQVKRRRRTRAASCGACKAPPHEGGTKLS